MTAFLDRLEQIGTRSGWQRKTPPSRWQLWLDPSVRLKPRDSFPLRLFFRQWLGPVLWIIVPQAVILLCIVFASVVRAIPAILESRRLLYRFLILLNSYFPFSTYLWAFVILLAFNFLLVFPRFYFWNRRAELLNRKGFEEGTAERLDVAVPEERVWPPPPTPDRPV